VKRNGIFRARLVACGYSQVSRVDFTESFAPVLNDVSFRIMLTAKIVWDTTSTVVDIETAFLHGDLDEEIYMDILLVLTTGPNKKLLL
jgi:Reverse transcriptase (RNA-dependent DNA polymerase)